MTREPDRFEETARELVRGHWIDHTESTVKHVAAALRQAADEALERAAQLADGGILYARDIRALKSKPAAAPAAETRAKALPDSDWIPDIDGRGEPVAPAPDFRALLVDARAFHPGCKQGTFTQDIERWKWKDWKEGTPFDWRCEVCKRIDAALADGGE